MIRPLIQTTAPALLLLCSPACGQATNASSPSESAEKPGQIEPSEEDFRLIEHRTAPPPMRQSERGPKIASTAMREHWVAAPVAAARARVLAIIKAAETRHALPIGLLDALIAVESAYRPDVVSGAGAMGLAQLMPRTARALGVSNPFDAGANVDGGARFLRAMIDKFGSIALALAAYNAGPAAVLRAGGVPANAETPAYVAKVLATWRSRAF